MKTIAITSLIVVLSAAAAFAQAGRQTMNQAGMQQPTSFADQEKAALDKICAASTDYAKRDDSYKAILEKTLLLSDEQKAVLKDYEDAQSKAIADAKSRLCANHPDLTSFEATLNFRQKMLEDQLETVKAINPKLIAFYNSLNPEQKNRFDQMREHMSAQTTR